MSLDESVESNYTIMNLPPLSQTAKGCPKRPTNNGITELCDRIRLACKTVVANETLVVATRTFSKRFTYENGQTSPDFIHETRPEEYENLELMSKRFIIGNGRSFWPQDRFKDKSFVINFLYGLVQVFWRHRLNLATRRRIMERRKLSNAWDSDSDDNTIISKANRSRRTSSPQRTKLPRRSSRFESCNKPIRGGKTPSTAKTSRDSSPPAERQKEHTFIDLDASTASSDVVREGLNPTESIDRIFESSQLDDRRLEWHSDLGESAKKPEDLTIPALSALIPSDELLLARFLNSKPTLTDHTFIPKIRYTLLLGINRLNWKNASLESRTFQELCNEMSEKAGRFHMSLATVIDSITFELKPPAGYNNILYDIDRGEDDNLQSMVAHFKKTITEICRQHHETRHPEFEIIVTPEVYGSESSAMNSNVASFSL